jgi:hypothetical protein
VYTRLLFLIKREREKTSKNLIVNSMTFSDRNIHKYTSTSPGEKCHNRIYHVQTDRRRHSSVPDVPLFRAVDCDNDHYVVVAKVRERLAANEQRSQRSHMERFNPKKWNEVEGKEQYRVEVSNRFVVLEDLNAEMEINSAWGWNCRSRKLRLTTVGDPPRWPCDTPLSRKVDTKFRRQVAVDQSV